MPIHDWSRVDAGLFHNFHQAWTTHLCGQLNTGVLPPSFYALIEQRLGPIEPDVLALHADFRPRTEPQHHAADFTGTSVVTERPPAVAYVDELDEPPYAYKKNTLVIHHVSDDRVVALIEVVSPGNKSSEFALERLTTKVAGSLMNGVHATVIDLHRHGTWDPSGIHHAIWYELGKDSKPPQDQRPLTLVAYCGMPRLTAYVQPVAVGDTLPAMPLFLDPDHYVDLPLESSYVQAFAEFPRRWQEALLD